MHGEDLDGGAEQRRERRCGQDLGRRPDGEAARGEVEHPVDEREHGVDLVGDEEHGGVVRAAARVEQLGDLALVVQVEAEQRLVAQEQRRLGEQRLGDPEALLLASAEHADGRSARLDAPTGAMAASTRSRTPARRRASP